MKKVILLLSFALCFITAIDAQISKEQATALMLNPKPKQRIIYNVKSSKLCDYDTTNCIVTPYNEASQNVINEDGSWYFYDIVSRQKKFFPYQTLLYGESKIVMFFERQRKILFLDIKKLN